MIIATGGMVSRALAARGKLDEVGLSCGVVNMHTIKPLDIEAIYKAARARLIVTVEEHSVTGGLGSSVAEVLASLRDKPPQLILGVSEGYQSAGTYEFMLDQHGLTSENIVDSIKRQRGSIYDKS